jgi:hypothetical protein
MVDKCTGNMKCRQRTREYGRTEQLRKQNQEGNEGKIYKVK